MVVCADLRAKNFKVRRVKNTDRIVLEINADAAITASKATWIWKLFPSS
jgi:hypothetical protein